jgi:hypothetical protein
MIATSSTSSYGRSPLWLQTVSPLTWNKCIMHGLIHVIIFTWKESWHLHLHLTKWHNNFMYHLAIMKDQINHGVFRPTCFISWSVMYNEQRMWMGLWRSCASKYLHDASHFWDFRVILKIVLSPSTPFYFVTSFLLLFIKF